MRRWRPPPDPEEGLRLFFLMAKEATALRALLSFLQPGGTLEDAGLLYKRLGQQSRRPSRLLDERYGVQRNNRKT
jgi:hypothetical protein